MLKNQARQLSRKPFVLTVPGAAILFLLAGLFWIFSSGYEPVDADHPTLPPEQNVYTVTFVTDDQSKWGPGTASPSPLTLDILPLQTWSETGDAEFFFETPDSVTVGGETIDIPSGTFGGAIAGATDGEIALGMEFADFGAGAVGVNYPVEAILTTPAEFSFNPGDTITIYSSGRVLPGAELMTESPSLGSVSLNGTLGFNFSIDQADVCIFNCVDLLSTIGVPPGVGFGIPTASGDIVTIEFPDRLSLDSYELAESIVKETLPPGAEDMVRSFIPDFLYDQLLHKGISEVATIIDNATPLGTFDGWIGLLDLDTISALEADGTTLTASGEDDFVELEVDLTGYFTSVPLSFSLFPMCIGDFCAAFSIDIAAITSTTNLTQEEEYEFQARPRVMLEFSETVIWAINPCVLDGFSNIDPTNPASTATVITCSGTSSTVIFDLGASVEITVPDPLPDGFMDVTPTFLLPNTISNKTKTTLSEEVALTVGEYSL